MNESNLFQLSFGGINNPRPVHSDCWIELVVVFTHLHVHTLFTH